jgi:lactate permease
MVYVMMNSGGATGIDSMILVIAKVTAQATGGIWYLVAPFVGMLGAFIAGSNTVSNIMFGPFQLSTATEAGIPVIPILALQTVGGAAANMIGIHSVVAALTTVGLIGKEGLVIRKNIFISILYGLLVGVVAWIMVTLFFPHIF